MYDYNQLYGQADTTAGTLIEKGNYDAVVERASWGMTSGGDKGRWEIKFRITTGPYAAVPLTTTLTVSPAKNDGTVNSAGLGIMFRQLGALGVPVPPNQPFWQLGWTEEQVAAYMQGRPALISVVQDEYDGVTRNKVRDIREPRPGAPLDWPRQQQAQPGFGQQAAVPGQPATWNPMAASQGQNGWGQQQSPEQVYQQATGQPQNGFQPGQGGYGEFSQQGQSQQPWQQFQPPQQEQPPQQYQQYGQPPVPPAGQPSPWNAPQPGPGQYGPASTAQPAQGYQQGPGAAPGQPQQGQPAQPPSSWQQLQQPQGPAGYQQGQQPQQPQQQGGPAVPPWAQ